jgi:hypothetical protein
LGSVVTWKSSFAANAALSRDPSGADWANWSNRAVISGETALSLRTRRAD